MEYRENPLLGRKVFFLNPPLSVENYIMASLKAEEYEVYKITNLESAKPVLKIYENAICFIFVDDILPLDGWFNFIKSFEYDSLLKTVFLGALSVKTKPKDQERFLMNLKLPGGFVMMDKKIEETKNQLEGILRINGAKGVRKFVRLELKDNKDVNGYFGTRDQLYSFRLIDISQVGFAAIMPVRMGKFFKNGSFINNVSITMGRYSITCSINVHATKVTADSCVVIAMFVDTTSKDVIQKIHNFVYETLEKRMREVIDSLPPDNYDYNIRIRASDDAVVDPEENEKKTGQAPAETKEASEAKETTENVEEVEEIEEIEEAQESKGAEAVEEGGEKTSEEEGKENQPEENGKVSEEGETAASKSE